MDNITLKCSPPFFLRHLNALYSNTTSIRPSKLRPLVSLQEYVLKHEKENLKKIATLYPIIGTLSYDFCS